MEFGARLPDEHPPVADARRARDGKRLLRIGGLGFPHLRALLCIDGDQTPIERAPDDLALPERDAAIGNVAAQAGCRQFPRHLRIVLPQLCAGLRIEGVHLAPRRGDVETAIGHHRGGLVTTALGEIGFPCKAHPAHVVGSDLLQRAVTLFRIVASMRPPLPGIRCQRTLHIQTQHTRQQQRGSTPRILHNAPSKRSFVP
jgi:hypothetical protein